MNGKQVKRLFDMQFDEVSVVDRPANQHGVIAFSKALEDDSPMDIFDAGGNAIDPDDLEHGDVVYGDDGDEFVVVEDDDDDVEKSFAVNAAGAATRVGSGMVHSGGASASGALRRPRGLDGVKRHLYNNRKRYAVGATVPAAGAAAYGGKKYMDDREEASKSLGDVLLEELSKAATEDERTDIIASALDEVEFAKAEAAEAREMAEYERDLRTTDMFIAKAAEYNVPVAPAVLGPILKSMAHVLDDEQLEVIDQLLNAVGDMLYDEVGYAGGNDNDDVLSLVNAHAADYVSKADVSGAQAVSDIFNANPELYDSYLAENGR